MGSSLLLILILSKDMNNLLMFVQFLFFVIFSTLLLYGYGLKKLVENKHYLLFFAIYYYAIKHIEIY